MSCTHLISKYNVSNLLRWNKYAVWTSKRHGCFCNSIKDEGQDLTDKGKCQSGGAMLEEGGKTKSQNHG